MVVDCGDSVAFNRDESLGIYHSSEWGERLFCKDCGTTLMWRSRHEGYAYVSAQTFDDPSAFEFTHQIFIDDKPGNYAFANETKTMTGADVFAAFSAAKES